MSSFCPMEEDTTAAAMTMHPRQKALDRKDAPDASEMNFHPRERGRGGLLPNRGIEMGKGNIESNKFNKCAVIVPG